MAEGLQKRLQGEVEKYKIIQKGMSVLKTWRDMEARVNGLSRVHVSADRNATSQNTPIIATACACQCDNHVH